MATLVLARLPCSVQAWIQIHKILPLEGKVGKVLVVEMKVVSNGSGDFHRSKVSLDVIRHLVRFVTFVIKGCAPMLLLVKYEAMPRYCAHCGLMRHVHLEYGTGEFTDEELPFGD